MTLKYLLVSGSLFWGFVLISQHSDIKYYKGNPDDSISIMEMLNKAREVYSSQLFDSVITLSESIELESFNANFHRGSGESYFLKARALNRLGYKYKAVEEYEKSLAVFESLKDHRRIASAYNNLGLIYKSGGEFREAITAGEQALHHADLVAPTKLNFHILNNLGNSYQNLALFKNATSSYFDALKVLQNEKDSIYLKRMQAEVYINLGIVYFEQKLYKNALEIYNHARLILENQQMKPQLATVYNNLGVTYTVLQDFKKAEKYISLANNLSVELSDRVAEAISINNLGKILFAQNKFEESVAKHVEAILALEKLNATTYLPDCYLELGETYIGFGIPDKALLSLMKGLQISLKSGQKVQELKLYEGLIKLYKFTNEPEMALMYYDLYSALSLQLNDQQIGRYIGQQELREHIDKRDQALKSLQSKTTSLEFQVNQRNIMLALTILILLIISVLFVLIYKQFRLKTKNKNLALEQKLLRTQLNPHFIFNALGAIQHYMTDRTPQDAARYLSKFSKLMRSILENSRTNKTTLTSELDTTKCYLDLQSLRFSKEFHYTIDLDPTLDSDLIQIPSLLIQPLLENAIEHGLRPKLGGWLGIEIKQRLDHIIVNIDDDGVGLKGPKSNGHLTPGKKRLGNAITWERLALINRKSKNRILLKVESRSKLNPDLSGTRASLVIPI